MCIESIHLGMPRGVIAKMRTRVLKVSVAEELIPLIARGMRKEGVVRSQFVRRAVREKLERLPNLKTTPKRPAFHPHGRRSADPGKTTVIL